MSSFFNCISCCRPSSPTQEQTPQQQKQKKDKENTREETHSHFHNKVSVEEENERAPLLGGDVQRSDYFSAMTSQINYEPPASGSSSKNPHIEPEPEPEPTPKPAPAPIAAPSSTSAPTPATTPTRATTPTPALTFTPLFALTSEDDEERIQTPETSPAPRRAPAPAPLPTPTKIPHPVPHQPLSRKDKELENLLKKELKLFVERYPDPDSDSLRIVGVNITPPEQAAIVEKIVNVILENTQHQEFVRAYTKEKPIPHKNYISPQKNFEKVRIQGLPRTLIIKCYKDEENIVYDIVVKNPVSFKEERIKFKAGQPYHQSLIIKDTGCWRSGDLRYSKLGNIKMVLTLNLQSNAQYTLSISSYGNLKEVSSDDTDSIPLKTLFSSEHYAVGDFYYWEYNQDIQENPQGKITPMQNAVILTPNKGWPWSILVERAAIWEEAAKKALNDDVFLESFEMWGRRSSRVKLINTVFSQVEFIIRANTASDIWLSTIGTDVYDPQKPTHFRLKPLQMPSTYSAYDSPHTSFSTYYSPHIKSTSEEGLLYSRIHGLTMIVFCFIHGIQEQQINTIFSRSESDTPPKNIEINEEEWEKVTDRSLDPTDALFTLLKETFFPIKQENRDDYSSIETFFKTKLLPTVRNYS